MEFLLAKLILDLFAFFGELYVIIACLHLFPFFLYPSLFEDNRIEELVLLYSFINPSG